MRIKDLPSVDRPREKLAKYGPDRLSDSELLAILIRTGTKGTSALELGGKLLKKITVADFANIQYANLQSIGGLGPTKSAEIIAALEFGRRALKGKLARVYLKPEDIWNEFKEYRGHKKEHFVALYLDSRSQEIKREIISIGTLNANLVHPREVFEVAIRNFTAQLVLVHNHPSGDPEPSSADILITKELVAAGKLLDIEVSDHIILGKNAWVSMSERGLL